MQPSSNTNKTYPLTQERRAHLYQILNDFDEDQLRSILTNHSQDSSTPNQFQYFTLVQLFQQCLALIDNCYSTDLEQTLYAMRQKRFASDFYQQQQSYYFPQQTGQFNTQPNYRFSSPSSAITQQLRAIRPTPISSQTTNVSNSRPQQTQSSSSPFLPRHQQNRPSSSSSVTIPSTSFAPAIQRYQVPLLPPPSLTAGPSSSSSSSQPPLVLPPKNNSKRVIKNKIVHKTLPFYRPITCVYERYNIFHYDAYRKQHTSHDEFTLSFDVCNQLALSYDYDSNLNMHKTTKCLLLRLVRLDQPAAVNGKYDDNLPPNVLIHINGRQLTNLPIPKASTRQQNDLIRIGREVDITSHCMFNPLLKNDITISWTYRLDNTNLQLQYSNAQYALHVFLVEHLSIEELYEQIVKKPRRFLREDLVRLLAKAHANDRDLGLEVSDQKLKLTCPIDQRRLKTPIRAVTCQHLQCFDLTNYIALNEKSNKWICPVCNKPAVFEDLQIDSYTESILTSIPNENITEITIDSDLRWAPIIPSNNINSQLDSNSNMRFISSSSSTDIIYLDDDD